MSFILRLNSGNVQYAETSPRIIIYRSDRWCVLCVPSHVLVLPHTIIRSTAAFPTPAPPRTTIAPALSRGLKRVFQALCKNQHAARSRVPWSSPRSRCWRMGRAGGLDGRLACSLSRMYSDTKRRRISDDFGETIARFPEAGASSSQSGGAQSSLVLHRRALMARSQRRAREHCGRRMTSSNWTSLGYLPGE